MTTRPVAKALEITKKRTGFGRTRLGFGQRITLDWNDQWPDAIWLAILPTAERKRIYIKHVKTNDRLAAWFRDCPGHWGTIGAELHKLGYELPFPEFQCAHS